jgi:NADH-quinone oxidoreductase subunit N
MPKASRFDHFEYPILIVLATLGMMLMLSANDMIALYMGLELQSLALYVVAAINRDSVRSTEAGLKYFVLGALSSGMLLYGMSLVYGFTGQISVSPRLPLPFREGASHRPDLRLGVHSCRSRLQDLRRAVPHVDAGRL